MLLLENVIHCDLKMQKENAECCHLYIYNKMLHLIHYGRNTYYPAESLSLNSHNWIIISFRKVHFNHKDT